MLSNRSFLEHEIPYRQLEMLGISKKGFMAANRDILKTIMSGGFSPLLKMKMEANGKTYHFLAKIRLDREPRGGVSLDILPLRTNTPKDKELRLDDAEMEHLRKGLILKKNVYHDSKKVTYYAQLDGETNSIVKVKARDIAVPSVVKDVDVSKQQRDAIREGMPIELDSDGTIYTIGIDLMQPNGIQVIQGNEDDWNQLIAREWDRINPGEIGFWLTDENGWEYMELQDSQLQDLNLEYEIDEDITDNLEEQRGGGIKL